MKVQVNNINKESNTMEENKEEVVGLKVNVTPKATEEEVVEPAVEEVVEPAEEAVEETTEEPETVNDEDPAAPVETVDAEVVPPAEDIKKIDPDLDNTYKKEACVRLFNKDGKVLYRSDIYCKMFEKNSGIFAFENTVDNFESARPENPKDFKDYFCIIGIIRWNFHNKYMTINTNALAAITAIESMVNEHIRSAKLKDAYEFRIDTYDL